MTTKTDRMETRLSPEQRRRIEQGAALTGQSTSAFVVDSAVDRADALIAAHTATLVPSDYFDRLLAALDEPSEASPQLASAAQRARQQSRITTR